MTVRRFADPLLWAVCQINRYMREIQKDLGRWGDDTLSIARRHGRQDPPWWHPSTKKSKALSLKFWFSFWILTIKPHYRSFSRTGGTDRPRGILRSPWQPLQITFYGLRYVSFTLHVVLLSCIVMPVLSTCSQKTNLYLFCAISR